MSKVRAYDKDGKEVVGWYICCHGRHIVATEEHPQHPTFYEFPDITTAAEDTGRVDRNGKRIFGSKGEMQGGDRVRLSCDCCFYRIEWRQMGWYPVDDGKSQVHKKHVDVWGYELEIIPKEKPCTMTFTEIGKRSK